MKRLLRRLGPILLVTASPACVYYNTFYNAKKQFEQAHEQRRESEADPENRILANAYLDYYLSAIRKASTVLDLHSDSKWVDDSLLLIGQSYYWRGEHRDALLKFDELLDNFPESELMTESLYWKALALWGNEDISQCRELLGQVGESDDQHFSWQARLALAELEKSRENYDQAVRNYLSIVDGIEEDQELETRLWKGLGDTYFFQFSYKNALNAYQKVLQSKPDDLTSYQTQLQIGSTQELTENLKGALATYEKMEGIKRFRRYQPKVRLRIANVYRLTGDIDGALETYDRIAERNPRTESSAEAIYQIAMIEHEFRRNNEKALELFAQARKERSSSDAAVRAREMETTLFQLDRFKKRAKKETKQGTEALFNVAEILLFSLGQVDSAVATYEQALARADSNFTAKALYGLGMIYADSLGNQAEASRFFQQLIDEHPVTPYAVDARRRIGQDRSDDVLAEARYVEAEALKSEGAPTNEVVQILQQVADEYPNSLYAPKSLFALGWAYENDLGDLDAATEQYKRLVDAYPMSDFAELSEDKIKLIAKERRDAKRKAQKTERDAKKDEEKTSKAEEIKRKAVAEHKETGAGRPSDADEASSSEDSESEPATPPPKPKPPQADEPLEASQIETLPTLIYAPPPPEAEELGEEDVSPNVSVRMLVGKDGKVKRVTIVDGSEVLQEKAVDVAFQYVFEPGIDKGKPREVWMEVPITFIPFASGREGEPQ